MLWNILLFPRTMSGEVELRAFMKVGKFGPICFSLFSVSSWLICVPTLFVTRMFESVGCRAFRSPMIYTGFCLFSRW